MLTTYRIAATVLLIAPPGARTWCPRTAARLAGCDGVASLDWEPGDPVTLGMLHVTSREPHTPPRAALILRRDRAADLVRRAELVAAPVPLSFGARPHAPVTHPGVVLAGQRAQWAQIRGSAQ